MKEFSDRLVPKQPLASSEASSIIMHNHYGQPTIALKLIATANPATSQSASLCTKTFNHLSPEHVMHTCMSSEFGSMVQLEMKWAMVGALAKLFLLLQRVCGHD